MRFWLSLALVGLMAFSFNAGAADGPELGACAKSPKGSKPQYRHDMMTVLMTSTLLIDKNSNSARPVYEAPEESCLLPAFDSALGPVQPIYAPFKKGSQTLLYRFLAGEGENAREILVLYSGTIGLVAGGKIFYLSETRGDNTLVYAIYGNQPRYKDVSKLVAAVLADKAAPVVGASWKAGDEGANVTIH